MADVRYDRARHDARAAAADTGGHGDVLLAVDAEGHREPLHGGAEPRLPEGLPGAHVVGTEIAIEVAGKREPATRREHRRQERRALLDVPHLAHRVHVEGGQLADVSVGARHLEELAIASRATRPLGEFHFPPRDLHARLGERNDEESGAGMVARRVPVVPAFRAWTRLDPLPDLRVDDLRAVARHTRFEVDAIEYVVEHRLLERDEFAARAIELPQDPRLADREHELPRADVDQDTLIDLV